RQPHAPNRGRDLRHSNLVGQDSARGFSAQSLLLPSHGSVMPCSTELCASPLSMRPAPCVLAQRVPVAEPLASIDEAVAPAASPVQGSRGGRPIEVFNEGRATRTSEPPSPA